VAEAEAVGVRSRDPYRRVVGCWIARRLSPDCDKVDLQSVFELGLEPSLLALMGTEAAHALGASHGQLASIASDLKDRGRWLREATKVMVKRVVKDWERWRADPLQPGAATE
jgi:hypothetical protein